MAGTTHGRNQNRQKQVNTETTPSFVYNENYRYWTMSQYSSNYDVVYFVDENAYLGSYGTVSSKSGTVRPVIHLYKTAIPNQL